MDAPPCLCYFCVHVAQHLKATATGTATGTPRKEESTITAKAAATAPGANTILTDTPSSPATDMATGMGMGMRSKDGLASIDRKKGVVAKYR